ncbi:MAG: transglycosylase SLT domain-containing protein [Gemmatimonadota bacterium]
MARRSTASARLALTTGALCLLVSLPFAVHFLQRRPPAAPAPPPDRHQAAVQLARGQYLEAYRTLESLVLAGAADARTHLQLARCEHRLGHPDRAYARLARLQGQVPLLEDYRRLWMARALDQMDAGDAAQAAYEDLLAACQIPAAADSARLYLAELCESRGQHGRALELYREQLGASPESAPALLYRMARSQQALPDVALARRTRLQLMEDHPGHRLALEALASLGRPRDAREALARAQVYYQHQDYRRAGAALNELLEAWPGDGRRGEAHYMLALSYLRSDQDSLARRTFQEVYDRYAIPAALYRIAGLQVSAGRDDLARETYERLARLHPGHELADDALWQAAKAAERHSEFGPARDLYQRLARTYPAGELADEAGWSVGFMDYCGGQYEAALAAFAEVGRTAREPHLVDQGLYWAGKSAEELGQHDRARSYFQQSARGFPRSYYSTRAVRMGYGEGLSFAPGSRAAPGLAPARRQPEILGGEFLDRGDLLAQLGMPDLAEGELVRAERLNDRDTDALRLVRDHLEGAGLLDRALALTTRIFVRDGDIGEIGRLYPSYYWEQIEAASREAQVDPYLVLSVIRQESYFNQNAVSPAGAIGLMQIMPETGHRLARALGVRAFEQRQLFDPQVSIRMGTRFLGDQVRSFMDGPTRKVGFELGLAAYNAGPKAAHQWVERYPYEDADAFVERIPYKETRLYVKKVLRNYTIYRTLSDV